MRKVLVFFALILAACAHHRDVRPGENNIYRVVIQTDNKEEGSREAINQANHYCEQKKQSAVFLNEEQKYTGDLDESTYNSAKRASSVAKTLGGGVFIFGGKQESTAGGVVGLGGEAFNKALGKGYTVDMRFKCQ